MLRRVLVLALFLMVQSFSPVTFAEEICDEKNQQTALEAVVSLFGDVKGLQSIDYYPIAQGGTIQLSFCDKKTYKMLQAVFTQKDYYLFSCPVKMGLILNCAAN